MIGRMSLGTLLRDLARCRLAAALLVAASLATGCDAAPQTSSTAEGGDELGRSASELDETDQDAADEDATDDEAPPTDVDAVGPPGGSSPLDPRAEPDPIPWVPRAHDDSRES